MSDCIDDIVEVPVDGPQGPPGGATYSGLGPPTNDVGVDRSTYYDEANGIVYGPKKNGVWPVFGYKMMIVGAHPNNLANTFMLGLPGFGG
jgi:hypothetical protein